MEKSGATSGVQSEVVGRLAPSPTGRMHLGNAFAALAAWLAVRSVGSQSRILLRIEDIDTPRCVQGADRWIMDDLTWLGLNWDGEPEYQSQRGDLYEQALKKLENTALGDYSERVIYPCYCTRKQLREASAPQESDGFMIYPGTCRHFAALTTPESILNAATPRHALRLAMPPLSSSCGNIEFTDRVYGKQRWNLGQQIGDIILRRSDGLFAYQLAVVVDDFEQGVNQVVRGRDLLRSTAAQIWLRQCLLQPASPAAISHPRALRPTISQRSASVSTPENPEYAHLPLLLNEQNKRLSKRYGSLELSKLKARGINSRQVIGYLAWLLGLVSEPQPCTAQELIPLFSWNKIAESKAGLTDRVTSPSILVK